MITITNPELAAIEPRLFRGEAAASLVSNQTFQMSWRQLHEKCPWATSGQCIDFVQTWYEVYKDRCEPVIVVQTTDGGLTGLLTLAWLQDTTSLVVAGHPQMAYEVWLATPNTSGAFIRSAIELVQRSFPGSALVFRHLPAATPIGWIHASHAVAQRCHLEPGTRPLLRIAGTDGVYSSLRKKGNKSKLSRLRRLGPVRLERISNVVEFEQMLNHMIPFYDLRQGALSGIPPFAFDRSKRAFYMAQMSKPGLLHVTVLKAGDTIVAANIGTCEMDSIDIGVFIYSPFQAQNSPGKLHLLLLAEEAVAQGFSSIDLTPGFHHGDYKDRFATHYDRVYCLTVFSSPWEMRLRTAKQKAVDWVKSKLDHAGFLKYFNAMQQVVRGSKRVVSRREMHIYTIEYTEARRFQNTERLACNRIEHLLAFQPTAAPHRRKDFFFQALRRLENGYHVYTAVDDGKLRESAWLIKGKKNNIRPEFGEEIEFPSGSVVLFDLQLRQPALEELLSRAAETSSAERIYLCIAGHNRSVCGQVVQAGGKLVCKVSKADCDFLPTGTHNRPLDNQLLSSTPLPQGAGRGNS